MFFVFIVNNLENQVDFLLIYLLYELDFNSDS